jgi:N-acetylated-alpha-linked acidic dipeptidase
VQVLLQAHSDPRDPIFAPARQDPPSQFDFAPLDKAVESLTQAAEAYDKAYAAALSTTNADPSRAAKLRSVNTRLLQAERALTSADGLAGRRWYRHLLYAPGFYTGYGVKTMPGVREALEQHQWKDVDREIGRVASALMREATLVGQLAEEVSRL